jgi:aminoglycoside phosphotransferase (APT) family kinase protein
MLREPGAAPRYIEALASLQRNIHRKPGQGFDPLKGRLDRNIRRAEPLSPALRSRLLQALQVLEDGDRLCHADFHPFNVLGSPDAPTVVDWVDASRGAPAADLCRSYVLMQPAVPDIAEAILAAALEASGIARDEVMPWMPVTAAARLAEGVPETEALLTMAEAV